MQKLLCLLFFIAPHLLQAQLPKLILPVGHTNSIKTISFNPNERQLLTSSADGTAKIWDAVTGFEIFTLKHDAPLTTSSYSHSGEFILSTSFDGKSKMWNAATGKLLLELSDHDTAISMSLFSDDDKLIATIAEHSINVWESGSGKKIYTFKDSAQQIVAITFSKDNKSILSVIKNGTLRSHVLQTAAVIKQQDILGGEYAQYTFTKDRAKIIAVDGDSAIIYDMENKIAPVKVKDPESALLGKPVADDKNEKLLVLNTFAGGGSVWNMKTGKLLYVLVNKNDGGTFTTAVFSHDGKYIATGSRFGEVSLWNAENGKSVAICKEYPGNYLGEVNAVSFSKNDTKVISCTMTGSASIYDMLSRREVTKIGGHAMDFYNLILSKDGKEILTTSFDNKFTLWDIGYGKMKTDFSNGFSDYNQGAFAGNGESIVLNMGNSLEIWQANPKHLLAECKGHHDIINSFSVSRDGDRIGTASKDSTAKIWNAKTGKLLVTLPHNEKVNNANFFPDGKSILTACDDKNIGKWDINSGKLLFSINTQHKWLTGCAISHDGQKLLSYSAGDSTTKIWDANDGHMNLSIKETEFINKEDILEEAVFTPNDSSVIAVTSSILKNWDISSGKLKYRIQLGKGYGGRNIAFLNSGKYFAITDYDSFAVNIYSVATGKLHLKLLGHDDAVYNVTESANGKYLFTTSEDNTSKIWNASDGKCIYTFFAIDSMGYFGQTPAGYYQCTPTVAGLLHYVKGDKIISFEQLDVKFNRPDLVLSAIGCPDTLLIKSYKKVWDKRIKKLAFDTTLFNGGLNVPEADFENRNAIRYEQKLNKLTLKIQAKDDSLAIDRCNVWINEVPLFGIKGISLKSRNKRIFDSTIVVTLSDSINRIEVSVTNVGGLESYRVPLEVKYEPAIRATEGKLFFIGIGIDHFKDTGYNLNWSVKDIRDLARNFKNKYGAACFIDTLFDKNVSIENVTALKQALLKTTEKDKVIIAYSGHGLLNDSLDYFLSTYTVDFHHPEKGGLPYQSLEDLLDGISARKKLMLIDACHSGEVDKEEVQKYKRVEQQNPKDAGAKGIVILKDSTAKLGTGNSFELMQELFANVGRSTGATIISAAAGTQFALEKGDLKNGVFTYSILSLMKKLDHTKISELKKYVNANVIKLTHGLQVPTSRSENKLMDWEIW